IQHDSSESSHTDPVLEDVPETYSPARNWLLTFPMAILLLAAIFFGTSAFIHGQLLAVGGQIWNGYSVLRADLPQPNCNPNPDIDAKVEATVAKSGESSGGLLDMGPADPTAVRQSLLTQRAQCREALERYEHYTDLSSEWTLRTYRSIERGMGVVATIGARGQTFMLVLLILFGGLAA